MDLYLFSILILFFLAVGDLMVGVSNDAVNFLNSSIGSRVAPRHVIMIVASLGILAGVTFSSGMMEVARKGIFHPKFFLMPELITIFLAVMMTDIVLLDLFNTFGLPTSTTVSIVFELLGAAVAVSLIKIHVTGTGFSTLVDYINTGKALAIIFGILLSVVIAFFCGAIIQFFARLLFTFNYTPKLKRLGGLWGGLSLSTITYFILIKGAKGTSFLTPETVTWIKTHTWLLMAGGFAVFGVLFQFLALYTRINILKPIVLIGTFALAMAFAGNDLVNFIGVPLAGLNAYKFAHATAAPLRSTMEALQKPIQSNTFLLLMAGVIMVVTLWISKKARSVTETEVNLGRQEEGMERFGSSVFSRSIVHASRGAFSFLKKCLPVALRKKVSKRMDPGTYTCVREVNEQMPSFDLLRASVNLFVASAVVSFATSLKLPLSTTYVTFMVAMGTSLSDQAWGRESAVYRIAGVLTVISGWFLTAFIAFTLALLLAFPLYYFKLPAILILLILLGSLVVHSYRVHYKRVEETSVMQSFSLKKINNAHSAINASFEQTGSFLKEISDSLAFCFEAVFSEDRARLRDTATWTSRIQKWANIIIENTFETLSFLPEKTVACSQKYAKIIPCVQGISSSHRDIIKRSNEHFKNFHCGFDNSQKEELRKVKVHVARLLWNTSIMLKQRKNVDHDYIANQCGKLDELVGEFGSMQIRRIQKGESTTRVNILYYALIQNALEIAEQTRNLLHVFKESFQDENVS